MAALLPIRLTSPVASRRGAFKLRLTGHRMLASLGGVPPHQQLQVKTAPLGSASNATSLDMAPQDSLGDATTAPGQQQQRPATSAAAAPLLGQAQAPPPQQQQAGHGKVLEEPLLMSPRQPLPRDPESWLNAAVLVDKPQGWTSFDVCAKLRGVVKIKKVGHAGTLDPMATGLLVVCIGRGTKHVDRYMGMAKEYSGTLRLGQGTPSYDAETEVQEEAPWQHITDEQLEAAKQQFIGHIQQVPPMYSALKVGGQKLCDAARKGKDIERQARQVDITALHLHRDAGAPQDVHFRVVCSKGTYVRSLAHDLGRALGSAAHLTALRRTKNGEQSVEDAWDLEELVQAIRALQLPDQRKRGKQQQQQQQREPKRRAPETTALE